MGLSKNSFIFNRLGLLLSILLLLSAANLLAADSENLLRKPISLDAEDASLSHVVANMAKMSGCNIVLAIEKDSQKDGKGKGDERRLTIHVKEVPIEQAIALVVKSVGLSYKIIGDKTFLVGEKGRIEEEVGERSYIANLNYISAEKVVNALEILPGDAVEIQGANQILIHANPETFAEISKRIEQIDVPQKHIESRASLIEVNVSDTKKMGLDWSRINSFSTILAEDPQNGDGVGLPYNYTDEEGILPHGEATDFAELPESQYFQRMESFDDAFHFSRQLYAFDLTLDWLLENNAAKLLTDTRITALNGEEAMIHIGEVIPYVVQDQEYNVQIEEKNVGIKLEVQPSINRDGQITTKIKPEVSSVIELVGGYVPRTKIRKVESTVTVPNGKKIIVGGLLMSKLNTKNVKVPFLGDLPFVGRFFRHESEVLDNTDLIIELTPKVVELDEHQGKYDIDPRQTKRLIKRK